MKKMLPVVVMAATLSAGCAAQKKADQRAQMMAIAEQRQDRAAAEADAVQDRRRAKEKAKEDAKIAAAAEAEEAERRTKKAVASACDETRAERLGEMKTEIRAWIDLVKRHGKWVDGNCSVEDTRGTLVSKERTSEGVIVRTKAVGEMEGIVCKGVRPAGLTDEQVETMVFLTEATLVGDSDRSCADADAKAGVDFIVRATDMDGMKAFLEK